MDTQISIIGLGWLGMPLAKYLKTLNFKIKGSSTSSEKAKQLNEHNLTVYKVLFTENNIEGNIKECLEGSKILILNTPPGLRKNPKSNYVAKIKQLIPHIETSSITKVIFIGSTTVFLDTINFLNITNSTNPSGTSNAAKQLIEVEQLLINNPKFDTTILRFSGLVDERRHPATMLSKRKQIPNPEAPVNLIHREDCIGIISKIIKLQKWNKIYNASYPIHTQKADYYNNICLQKKLPLPNYNYELPSKGKIIDGSVTETDLQYTYLHSILNT